MKSIRFVIFTLSIILLTLCSGLLYFRGLGELEANKSEGLSDFHEIRIIDLQLTRDLLSWRINLDPESLFFDSESKRLKELVNIITDVYKNNRELKTPILEIRSYFDKKFMAINTYKKSLLNLKKSLDLLGPTYNELSRNKIKFAVDKKDFYRETLIDALFYVSMMNKDNEERLFEDKKILGQIINFSNSPNPIIVKFNKSIESIAKETRLLRDLNNQFENDSSFSKEMNIINKYYQKIQEDKFRDKNFYLYLIFSSIILYLISIILLITIWKKKQQPVRQNN